jgi:arginine decarboxylase
MFSDGIVTRVKMTAGTAGGADASSALNAVDAALLEAGIANVNLVELSSILPPDATIVPLPRIRPGAIVPAAYAAMVSDVPGDTIAAAVGWALPEDRQAAGVIMEVHDRVSGKEAERRVEEMLDAAFRVRGARMRDRAVFVAEHHVVRVGCALAAVALLGIDDLLDSASDAA